MKDEFEDEVYDWCKDYMDEEEAIGLAKLFSIKSREREKRGFVFGVIAGVMICLILAKWLS